MDFNTDFHNEYKQRQQYIETVIKSYIPTEFNYQETIVEAMTYNLSTLGKRIRPMLMLEVSRLFGGDDKNTEPFMAAVEMIHTYSLIHDDLPALDNDDYRRGRKTTHVVYGEAMAILTGDALLNYAFETATSTFSDGINHSLDIKIAKSLKILSQKSGIYGMIGGQVADIEGANTIDKIDFIYKLKTSALIEASMMIGAILAGALGEQVQLIEKVARDIGIAFQIQDDILDVTGNTGILGKPIGSDDKNNKVTYVTLLGLEKAKKTVEEMSDKAIRVLKELFIDDKADNIIENEFLTQLIINLINREK